MIKTIRFAAISIAVITSFIISSCNTKGNEEPPRTPEIERTELNAALTKLESEGYDIDTSALGIYYIIQTEGEGPLAQAGDSLKLEYTGYLLSGLIFDASVYHYTDGIWEFKFKEGDLIPGFDDGISLMKKGTEIDMLIPSELAYGAASSGNIKPYSTLMFSAKMHDIKPKTE